MQRTQTSNEKIGPGTILRLRERTLDAFYPTEGGSFVVTASDAVPGEFFLYVSARGRCWGSRIYYPEHWEIV